MSFPFPPFNGDKRLISRERQKSLDEAVLLPTGKGFKLDSDLNLRQALLDGYECHKRPQSPLPFRHEEEEEEEDGEEKRIHGTNS